MGRYSTIPDIYDAASQFPMSFLVKHGYIEPGYLRKGGITWSRNGYKTGSIGFTVDMSRDYHPYIRLEYLLNGKDVEYIIDLDSVPSNLGKGNVWYFICPRTGKRCRILYGFGGYWYHREAFSGALYRSQTYSHRDRYLCRVFDEACVSEKIYDELNKKHFKRFYNGKPTKRYQKLLDMRERAKKYSVGDIEKMIMGIY